MFDLLESGGGNDLFDQLLLRSQKEMDDTVKKVQDDTRTQVQAEQAEQSKKDFFSTLEVEDKPGQNILTDFINGKIGANAPRRVETFEEFISKRNPAADFLTSIAQGQLARLHGKQGKSHREKLFEEFQVEQRGQIAQQQMEQQNQQNALRLAFQEQARKRQETIQARRDQVLGDMKKELQELKGQQKLEELGAKGEQKLAELEFRGKLAKELAGFKGDLRLDLEKTKFKNRESLADTQFERAKELTALKASLRPKGTKESDQDVVGMWTDLADAGLVSREKLMSSSKMNTKDLAATMKNIQEQNILLFPTEKERQLFNDRKSVLSVVADVNNELFQLEGLFSGDGPNARLKGAMERAKAGLGLNSELQAILQRIKSLGPTLARASGDRGNIAIQEQVKAIEGYLATPGSTKLEGEKLFDGAMVTVMSNVLPTLQSMQGKPRDSNDPRFVTTIRQQLKRAKDIGRDPVDVLMEAVKDGMTFVPEGF